jgi:hypothetical protein
MGLVVPSPSFVEARPQLAVLRGLFARPGVFTLPSLQLLELVGEQRVGRGCGQNLCRSLAAQGRHLCRRQQRTHAVSSAAAAGNRSPRQSTDS